MIRSLTVTLALASATGAAAVEPPAIALMRNRHCYICHADHETLAGPSFVEVAARYRGDSAAAMLVASAIRNGARSGGPWHMAPHPEISTEEAARIARYILTLDPHPAPPQLRNRS